MTESIQDLKPMAAYIYFNGSFWVTHGVAVLQRLMDNIIKEEQLKYTFPYLDDISVAGVNQADHDYNVEAFIDVVKRQKLTLNHDKSVISASSIDVLGYIVRDGNIRPDPERLRPLNELPLSTNVQSQRKTLGLFAYYAKWIPEFSSKPIPSECKRIPSVNSGRELI